MTVRQHRGVPGTAVPSAGHGCHRLGSLQGVLLEMGHAGETVRSDAGVRLWGFYKLHWLLGELQKLQDTLTWSPGTASLPPPLGQLWGPHLPSRWPHLPVLPVAVIVIIFKYLFVYFGCTGSQHAGSSIFLAARGIPSCSMCDLL